MDWFLDYYVVSILISCNLCFKVCFVWYEDWYSSFLCFPFARSVFFHPLTFSLYVSWGLKQVSCWQHIYGSCFCIHSTSLCLLVGAFNRLTFKIIIAVYFCLSEKLLISPPIMNEILVGYSNFGCRFFPFSTWNISCPSLLACRVSAERSAVKHLGCPLYVTCCFSLWEFSFSGLGNSEPERTTLRQSLQGLTTLFCSWAFL